MANRQGKYLFLTFVIEFIFLLGTTTCCIHINFFLAQYIELLREPIYKILFFLIMYSLAVPVSHINAYIVDVVEEAASLKDSQEISAEKATRCLYIGLVSLLAGSVLGIAISGLISNYPVLWGAYILLMIGAFLICWIPQINLKRILKNKKGEICE